MLPDELIDEFKIAPDARWPVEDSRHDPVFHDDKPLWIDFEEFPDPDLRPWPWEAEEALFVGFDDFDGFDELDPARLEEPKYEAPEVAPQRASATSLFGSLGIHIVVLLALLGWSRPTADIAPPIAVALIVEAAAPTGPTPPDSNLPPAEMLPKPTTEPPKPLMQTTNEVAQPHVEPPPRMKPKPPAPPPKVAAAAPPKPAPPPKVVAAPPKPRPLPPPKVALAAPPAPAPTPRREEPIVQQPVPTLAPIPAPAPRPMPVSVPATQAMSMPVPQPAQYYVPAYAPPVARAPGTDETKGDYYATLRELTRQHVDMLGAAFLGGRRGETILRILVMRDGTIAQIAVAQGSGYPDVDSRIEQMVTAVGRFPPLPAAFQGPSADLQLKLLFPDALSR